MSNIYIFRGKAATGKTTITNRLSKEMHIPVLRKDDIYDALSIHSIEHSQKNNISYDIMAKTVQTNIELDNDLILDIALPHKLYAMNFLSKINFDDAKVYNFLCICSDDNIWRERIDKRCKNPMPHQIFADAHEAEKYYNGFDISPLDDEIIIDSIYDLDKIIEIVKGIIKSPEWSEKC